MLLVPAVAQAQAPMQAAPGQADIYPDADRWRVLLPGAGVRPRNPLWDPYNQNILKGDIPIIGDNIFFAFTGTLDTFAIYKRNLDFFTSDVIRNVPYHEHNLLFQTTATAAFEIFQGDTVFAPKDWAIRLTPIFRFRCGDKNAIDQGCGEDARMFEAFGEVKLFEIGSTFDATSLRVGLQAFNADFFGLIYNDVQPGGRVFGELERNRYKFNLAAFDRLNKEKLSALNEWKRRNHQVGIANAQFDDFFMDGFNVLPFYVYSQDDGFAGGGTLTAHYLGFETTGRIGRFNVNTAFAWVGGRTANNTPLKRDEEISAGMAFAQVAYPIQFWNPRLAVAWASGDHDATDGNANGFDSVFDNVNFGGGQFSYLFGEKIQFGQTTVFRGNSIFPSLRGANATSNYVNPGAIAINPGVDVAVTPKTLFEANYNYVRFDNTASLEFALKKKNVRQEVGHEFNMGVTYRPFLNEQVILFGGAAVFFPSDGIKDTFGTDSTVYKFLTRLILTF
jgi:hypothetical protein